MQTRQVERPVPSFGNITPKISMRRNYLADNLKQKADELVQQRLARERRKHTTDITMEKLTLNKCETTDNSFDGTEMSAAQKGVIYKKFKRPHKESMAKPLTTDSEDESPYSRKHSPNKYYKDIRVSENMSRLIDDKRSTIKEQIEDEEEFTGSSLNVSQNLHIIRASKKCKHKKRESTPSNKTPNKESEPHSRGSLRKYSDQNFYKSESTPPPIRVEEKPRKYTDNMLEKKGF